MPVLKVKGMRNWCPAVSISSCLSLISILRGNLVRLCRFNRCISLGGKSFVIMFSLEWGRSSYLSVDLSGFRVRSGYCNTNYANWLAKLAP